MKLRNIFPLLFALANVPLGNKAALLTLPPINLAAPSRFGKPPIGWRKTRSLTRHHEIQKRRRRNARLANA